MGSILQSSPAEVRDVLNMVYRNQKWETWDTEVLLHEVFSAYPKTDEAADKVAAVQAVLVNPTLCLEDSAGFEKVVHAFCNNACVMDLRQAPYVEEILYTIEQLKSLAPNCSPGGDVPEYVAGVAKYWGWLVMPRELQFAQDMLDNLNSANKGEKYALVQAVTKGLNQIENLTPKEVLSSIPEDKDLAPEEHLLLRVIGAELYDPCIAA
ncbi:MAG: hypothetical protein KVP17_002618 [Porospora cf. gigantea B]|uniref:uncharacterized protein n=1 Tax=Porospora cf. gigantea B TaxID=2853592 RepID=UPI003571E5E7|nr:MAG: hypothetical protein KVP17_002618 [Porospora cf. gigantea B]